MLFDLVPLSMGLEIFVAVSCVSSNCEIGFLSVEVEFSKVDVLFCDGLAFIFIPILFFLIGMDFLLDNNPVFSDHNDAFIECPEFSYGIISNDIISKFIILRVLSM